MKKRTPRTMSRIKLHIVPSTEPMPAANLEAAERLLAKMIVRWYVRHRGVLSDDPKEDGCSGETDLVDSERRPQRP